MGDSGVGGVSILNAKIQHPPVSVIAIENRTMSPNEDSSENPRSTKSGSLIGVVLAIEEPIQQARLLKLLMDDGVDVNATDRFGKTALMHAATLGARPAVQTLLGNDRVVSTGADYFGNTPLMLACSAGHNTVALLLLEHLKKTKSLEAVLLYLDVQNNNGDTALTLALKNGHVDCANLLSEYLKEAIRFEKSQAKLSNSTGRSAQNVLRRRARSQQSRRPSNVPLIATDRFPFKSANGRLVPSVTLKKSSLDRPKLAPAALGSIYNGISLPDLSGSTGSINAGVCDAEGFPQAEEKTKRTLPTESVADGRFRSKRYSDAGEYRSKSAAAIRSAKLTISASKTPVALKTRQTIKTIQDMMSEKKNVARHGKVQRLFRVESDGSPSGGEEPFSPSLSRSSLSDRFRRLFDRRCDYVPNRLHDSEYSKLDDNVGSESLLIGSDLKSRRRSSSDKNTHLSNVMWASCTKGSSTSGHADRRRSSLKKDDEFRLPPLSSVKIRNGR